QRDLSETTIETHLAYYVSLRVLDIDDLVPLDKQELIHQSIQQFGKASLRQLKEHLPEEISYGDIKLTIASTETIQ
ncbi:helix-turn-helix domain-containing protein, partial [Parvimonas micra]|uniref:helix-turn-helix domain-containing protein n=1 Tax=Parvimonas micra TaxID=33033 RepID=UPI002B4A5B4A